MRGRHLLAVIGAAVIAVVLILVTSCGGSGRVNSVNASALVHTYTLPLNGLSGPVQVARTTISVTIRYLRIGLPIPRSLKHCGTARPAQRVPGHQAQQQRF